MPRCGRCPWTDSCFWPRSVC
ncbi:hypothetical protein [Streptomyces sp. TP-A0356]